MSEKFVSRAGEKLDHALAAFNLDVTGKVCADLGCSTGGFTDCLLQRGAAKVYAVDTGYGVLEWKLRQDSRVVVMERTNALHVSLPEKPALIAIDVGWTRQKLIIPHALSLLSPGGNIISLVKLHYEARKDQLDHGRVRTDEIDSVLSAVLADLRQEHINVLGQTMSPILGEKGKNTEYLIWIGT